MCDPCEAIQSSFALWGHARRRLQLMGTADFILWGPGPPQAADSMLSLVSHYGAIHTVCAAEVGTSVIITKLLRQANNEQACCSSRPSVPALGAAFRHLAVLRYSGAAIVLATSSTCAAWSRPGPPPEISATACGTFTPGVSASATWHSKSSRLVNANGGQRRDRTADAGLFRAA
jgi:hypothetical protein